MINLESLANRLFVIVRALNELATTIIAYPRDSWGIVDDVIGALARRAGAPARHSPDNLLIVNAKKNHGGKIEKLLSERLIERSRLRQCSRIAIHHESFGAIVAAKSLGDNLIHQVVRHQLAIS